MKVFFQTAKLERECTDEKLRVLKLGRDNAKRLKSRLDTFFSADYLEDTRNLPGHLHELTGNLKGLFAVDLDANNRILFRPANDPQPRKKDGGWDWSKIDEIEILEIKVDYHGK